MEPTRLDREAIFSLLTSTAAGRLITLDPERDETYVVPVNFVCLGRSIYFYTEAGRKLAALRAHPRNVALEIDRHDAEVAWSVLAVGDFSSVDNKRERAMATAGLLTKYRKQAVAPIWGKAGGHWPAFLQGLSQAKLGAIRIRRVSGRQWA
ncbi:MAG: pyridoxamine 5'-phosphate oxidase family protein [Chloroflexota bacterium]